jgi:hypothetical protein
MAVNAYDFARLDLVEDPLPSEPLEAVADVEVLFADVVELQDHRIGFSAVGAGMFREVLEEEFRPFAAARSLSGYCLVDVTLPVRNVMLPSVLGPTRPAVRVGAGG